MKLSKLVFECVRDSIQLSNPNMSYISFVNGDYDNSKDYIRQISSVFGYLNLAISRLYDNDKIPYATKKVEVKNDWFTFEDGEVINVVKLEKSSYTTYDFRTLNFGKEIVIFSKENLPSELLVEYRKKIPHFDIDDMKTITLDETNQYIVEDTNIEMEDYGITDFMCAYLKEFVSAQLTEYLDPTMSNNHNNRAEQYFQSIKQASTSFYQSKVKNNARRLL